MCAGCRARRRTARPRTPRCRAATPGRTGTHPSWSINRAKRGRAASDKLGVDNKLLRVGAPAGSTYRKMRPDVVSFAKMVDPVPDLENDAGTLVAHHVRGAIPAQDGSARLPASTGLAPAASTRMRTSLVLSGCRDSRVSSRASNRDARPPLRGTGRWRCGESQATSSCFQTASPSKR
jgi:hypothetical protein